MLAASEHLLRTYDLLGLAVGPLCGLAKVALWQAEHCTDFDRHVTEDYSSSNQGINA